MSPEGADATALQPVHHRGQTKGQRGVYLLQRSQQLHLLVQDAAGEAWKDTHTVILWIKMETHQEALE